MIVFNTSQGCRNSDISHQRADVCWLKFRYSDVPI